MSDETRKEAEAAIRVRDQLALGAIACLLLSIAMGMLPDGLVPDSIYRTGAWLIFGVLAFVCFYLAFPHMWPYSIWLAGIYGGSAFGLLLIAGRGGTFFPHYWTAALIGLLFEGAAMALVYTVLMRVRIARTVIGSRAPLGIWLLGVVIFFLFSNLSAAGWAFWAVTGSTAGLAGYAGFEALLAFIAVYVCWAPEELVWGSPVAAVIPEDAPVGDEHPAILKMLTGKKDPLPKACPACGHALRPVQLKCPSCGEKAPAGWCAANESYVVPCPSCSSPALSADGRCRKCGTAMTGLACPSCKRSSPFRDWTGAPGPV